MIEFWKNLSRTAKTGFIGGATLIVLALVLTTWWVLRTEYQVLFSELKPQDARVMTAELERLKIPYKLGDSGTAILVDAATVHGTRIKLMGKDLPLHGAVGFELFNNTDFGMTEFAQKINYQRALQGELTRTMLSLAEVRDVRVHLALPEQGLFKQATARAKASINLTLRQGETLRTEQVTGIQRLVAAAVPGMTMQDVTIVDNRGVALTRATGVDGELDSGGLRLDLKRDTESYLSRKAGLVLDRVFGPGQALASVDVTLNMDQMRVTTEDVIGTPTKTGVSPTGVVVRERETLRDAVPPLDARKDAASRNNSSSQREVDYAVGRRVEQVIGQPGSIRRLQVVIVVRKPLDATEVEQVQRLLSAAVGAVAERGDTVVVQTLGAIAPAEATASHAPDTLASTAGSPQTSADDASAPAVGSVPALAILIVLTALVAVAVVLFRRPSLAPVAALTEAQRSAALQRVKGWMQQEETRQTAQSAVSSRPPGGVKA
jgi:flagellar M-ring protein FliF